FLMDVEGGRTEINLRHGGFSVRRRGSDRPEACCTFGAKTTRGQRAPQLFLVYAPLPETPRVGVAPRGREAFSPPPRSDTSARPRGPLPKNSIARECRAARRRSRGRQGA